MRRFSVLISAAALLASFTGAHAQQRVQVGVLECRGGSSVGFIVGSVTNLGCVLRVDGAPDDSYVATIRKVGLDLGITQEIGAGLGRLRAGGAARARRSLRQLCRRARQRLDRRRPRRQRAGRRLGELDRAAAAQRAGPGRPQLAPGWKAWNCGRDGNTRAPDAAQREPVRCSAGAVQSSVFDTVPALRTQERCTASGTRYALHSDVFPACQISAAGGASACRPNHGPSSRRGGGNGTRRQKSPRSTVHRAGGPFPKR